METLSLLEMIYKDGKIVPIEIVSKYAQSVNDKVKNGFNPIQPVVCMHFL
jgi:hypothetical protein